MDTYDFNAKHILVTGATGGLGSALVKKLAEKGARLAVSARSSSALKELTADLPNSPGAVPLTADLSLPGEAGRLAADALQALDYIDVLFNIAGMGYFALMEEATEENIRRLFELNTFSPLALIKTLVPHMKSRGGGRVINIVSCAGRIPIPTVGVYGGSKSALAVMANTMRLELAPAGIDILNIYPGTVDNAFEENALREADRPGLCPLDHCGRPRFEIAEKILAAAAGPPGEAWLERAGKWLSVAAIAWPGYLEKRLTPIRDKVIQSKSLKKRRWRLLQVESAIACNLRCVMCPWREIAKKTGNRGIMTPAVWEGIRPHLPEAVTIDFTGGGEPLLQPHLVEWVREAKAAGCETGILTNGLLLKEPLARSLLDAGLDMACVSMDGATAEIYNQIRVGSNFDTVCENLRRLNAMRNGARPKTMINFVLMPMNVHQVQDMIHLAHDLGVDQVNFKQCDVIRGDQGKGFGLFADKETKAVHRLQKALSRARALADKLGIETTAFSFLPEEQPVCEQDPRDSVFIRYDGAVGPCINLAIGGPTTFLGKEVTMPTVHYGRLPEEELETLFETRVCQFFRQRFQERVQVHEDHLVQSMISASGRQRAVEAALAAMPQAPKGCRVCHYLYDI